MSNLTLRAAIDCDREAHELDLSFVLSSTQPRSIKSISNPSNQFIQNNMNQPFDLSNYNHTLTYKIARSHFICYSNDKVNFQV